MQSQHNEGKLLTHLWELTIKGLNVLILIYPKEECANQNRNGQPWEWKNKLSGEQIGK